MATTTTTRIEVTESTSALIYRGIGRKWVRAMVRNVDGPQAVPYRVEIYLTKKAAIAGS